MGPLNIYFTGNIASGKTTLTQLASSYFENACYIPEPYETNPFLPLYLQDQRRWGFTSAVHYFWDYTRKYAELTATANYHYCFVDAGTWTNRLVYGEYLYYEQVITADEHAFYLALCEVIEKAYNHPPPDGFVFVMASPQACWERMHQRGWTYQTATVQLAYIETLERYLETMRQTVEAKGIPTLIVCSEDTDYSRPEGQQEVLHQLEGFLQRCQRPHP